MYTPKIQHRYPKWVKMIVWKTYLLSNIFRHFEFPFLNFLVTKKHHQVLNQVTDHHHEKRSPSLVHLPSWLLPCMHSPNWNSPHWRLGLRTHSPWHSSTNPPRLDLKAPINGNLRGADTPTPFNGPTTTCPGNKAFWSFWDWRFKIKKPCPLTKTAMPSTN